MGLLTVAIVTSPLAVEGKIRYEQAFRGIEELRQNTDSLLIINNENILEIYGRLSLKQAFRKGRRHPGFGSQGYHGDYHGGERSGERGLRGRLEGDARQRPAYMAVATAEGDNRAEAVAGGVAALRRCWTTT